MTPRFIFYMARIFAFSLFLLMSNTLYSQPANPNATDPDTVPIHGLAYLLVAGGVIGVKKILGRKNNKSQL